MTEANIKARDKYLTCFSLSGKDNLRYKQLNMELNHIYIMGLNGYPQDLPGVMKVPNTYIPKSNKKQKLQEDL